MQEQISHMYFKHDGTYNSGGLVRQGVTPSDDPEIAAGAWYSAIRLAFMKMRLLLEALDFFDLSLILCSGILP
jgi:hypothetical protein